MNLPGLVDFHCHSTASDGSLAPEAVVELAHAQGVEVMSLTDHDTTGGLAAARAKAKELGMGWVDGIELSAKYEGGNLHLLGYGFDPEHKGLQEGLKAFVEARRMRLERILEKLDQLGLPLTRADLALPRGTAAGRPHIAAALLAKGYVSSHDEAFDKYLGRGGLAYVDKEIYDPAQAVALIKDAGGLAIVAHPVSLQLKREELAEYIAHLKDLGLDGLEAFNSSHERDQCNRLVRLAADLRLMVTAGSDFHGAAKPKVKLGRLKKSRKILSKWISPEFFDRLGLETT